MAFQHYHDVDVDDNGVADTVADLQGSSEDEDGRLTPTPIVKVRPECCWLM